MLQKGAHEESLQELTSDERCDVGFRQYFVSLLQTDANRTAMNTSQDTYGSLLDTCPTPV